MEDYQKAAICLQATLRQDREAITNVLVSKGITGNFLHAKALQVHADSMRRAWRLIDGGRKTQGREGDQAYQD